MEEKEIRKKRIKKIIINTIGVLGLLIPFAISWWAFKAGLLTDAKKMEELVTSMGAYGVFFFIFLQIFQTVVPIIPGALTCVAGIVIYGYFWGMIYNYIGIMIGGACIFWLVRKYGEPFVKLFVTDETYDKYIKWVNTGERFDRFFIFMMLFPISPADFICGLAGLTKMTFKRYMFILAWTKPFSIFTYSYGLTKIVEYIYNFFV